MPVLVVFSFTGDDRQQDKYVKYIACYAMTSSKKERRDVKYRRPGRLGENGMCGKEPEGNGGAGHETG